MENNLRAEQNQSSKGENSMQTTQIKFTYNDDWGYSYCDTLYFYNHHTMGQWLIENGPFCQEIIIIYVN